MGVLVGPERTVIALYYHEGLTMKEIGRVMGISESRVCQIHTKTLKKLKVHIDELGEKARLSLLRSPVASTRRYAPRARDRPRRRSRRRLGTLVAPSRSGRMDHFHHRTAGSLCEDVPLDALADAVGTPAYVYSAAHHPSTTCDRLREAFAALDPLICYAMKANANLAVLRLFVEAGHRLRHRVRRRARSASSRSAPTPRKVVFSGVGKTEEEMTRRAERRRPDVQRRERRGARGPREVGRRPSARGRASRCA